MLQVVCGVRLRSSSYMATNRSNFSSISSTYKESTVETKSPGVTPSSFQKMKEAKVKASKKMEVFFLDSDNLNLFKVYLSFSLDYSRCQTLLGIVHIFCLGSLPTKDLV